METANTQKDINTLTELFKKQAITILNLKHGKLSGIRNAFSLASIVINGSKSESLAKKLEKAIVPNEKRNPKSDYEQLKNITDAAENIEGINCKELGIITEEIKEVISYLKLNGFTYKNTKEIVTQRVNNNPELKNIIM